MPKRSRRRTTKNNFQKLNENDELIADEQQQIFSESGSQFSMEECSMADSESNSEDGELIFQSEEDDNLEEISRQDTSLDMSNNFTDEVEEIPVDDTSNLTDVVKYNKFVEVFKKLVKLEMDYMAESVEWVIVQEAKRKRENLKDIYCDNCGVGFISKKALESHKTKAKCKRPSFMVFSGTRIPCILSGCPKNFLNLEGIKYHLNTHVHPLSMLYATKIPKTTELEGLLEELKSLEVPTMCDPFKYEISILRNSTMRKSLNSSIMIGFGTEANRIEKNSKKRKKGKSSIGPFPTEHFICKPYQSIVSKSLCLMQQDSLVEAPMESFTELLHERYLTAEIGNFPSQSVQLSHSLFFDSGVFANVGISVEALDWAPMLDHHSDDGLI
jgi:hypothetical protein